MILWLVLVYGVVVLSVKLSLMKYFVFRVVVNGVSGNVMCFVL